MNPCTCAEHAETFTELVTSVAHWELELFIILITDVLLGAIAWPLAKRWWAKHHSHEKCDPDAPKFRVRPVVKNGRVELEAREDAPHARQCRDGHPNCHGDDPWAPGGGVCHCPNVHGTHEKRTSCPPPGIGRG